MRLPKADNASKSAQRDGGRAASTALEAKGAESKTPESKSPEFRTPESKAAESKAAGAKSAQEICNAIAADVKKHVGGVDQSDDITLVVLKKTT